MVRLTRAQQQARTRAAVLGAAASEFEEHGYAEAKVDRIAERAELTRGAVYSNFSSKRSLYLAVLLDEWPHRPITGAGLLPSEPAFGVAAAAEAFARVWLERLPLAGDTAAGARLRARSVAGVFDDEPGRRVLGELTRLEGLLLGLALESCQPPGGRRVRLAETILTLLHGADHLAESAPGFGDPFDLARACGHLTSISLHDEWDPPHLPFIPAALTCDDPWEPPEEIDDGVLVVLGARRLGAAEEAVRAVSRAASPGADPASPAAEPDQAGSFGEPDQAGSFAEPEQATSFAEAVRAADNVTIAAVTSDPAEIGALVRLRVSGIMAMLRQIFPGGVRPPVRIILDGAEGFAHAVGVPVGDDTEAAVRIRDGRIIARADGRGAGHAAATA
ncbi:TetR family transcriptional regulator [Actinoplanes lobatus]|uniref:AcrR family transcriptional regulator n=1 Tax=Actinoplanes lobatus TaxID=113568 RepID=A0A7W7MKN0_9ACTN|nr:helix-turn-helix domain-containing protein [Actinoplanes lobatus]MBB4753255.1 AcrR family transcriptional regulator [Actinoplanes lobatus]GGN59339.1 TetR family transcriptional regulator [Actinoplanes lobatus]GIE37788.1 TetR family transcriptional regulator [Actinoplanes lobatus]